MRLPKPWRVVSEPVEAGDLGTADTGSRFAGNTNSVEF